MHKKNILFLFSMWVVLLPAFSQEFDIDQLIKDVQSGQLNSVDDILDQLPEDMRENYSLVYETRNKTQFASVEEPRIILFSSDGKTQLTFTGNPKSKGGNKLEMIQLNNQGAYDFYELSFPFDGKRTFKNPKSCKACHGDPPRPIWDDYPKWRGVYGSNHDVLKDERVNRGNDNYDPDNQKRKHNEQVKASPGEYQNLENFKQNNANKMRYKYLKGIQEVTYSDLANKNSYLNKTLAYNFWDQLAENVFSSPASKKYLDALYQSFRQPNDFELYLYFMKDKAMMREIENEIIRLNKFKGDDFDEINKSLESANTDWPFGTRRRLDDRQGFTQIQAIINIIYDKQGKPKPFDDNLAGTSYYSFGQDGDNRLSKLHNTLQNHAYDIFGKHEYRHLTEIHDAEWKSKFEGYDKKIVSNYIPPDPKGSHLKIEYENLLKIIKKIKEDGVPASSLTEKESYLLQLYLDQGHLDYQISVKNEQAVKNYLGLLELVAGEKNVYQNKILTDFAHHQAAFENDYLYNSFIDFKSSDYLNNKNQESIKAALASIRTGQPELYGRWSQRVLLENDISKFNQIAPFIYRDQRRALLKKLQEDQMPVRQKKQLMQNILNISNQTDYAKKPRFFHLVSKDLHQVFQYLEDNIEEIWVKEFVEQNKELIKNNLPKVKLSHSSKIRSFLGVPKEIQSYSTARYLATLISLCLK